MRLRLFSTALLAALALSASVVSAQELNCSVSLNRQALSGTEYEFLDDLRDEIDRYLRRAWTEAVVDPREQIDCQVQITITAAPSQTTFQGQVVLLTQRPIYGTAQTSTTLRLSDSDWTFSYTRGQALIYDPNRFDALTSLLDFYALIMVGTDADTFRPLGGTPQFERARRIADIAIADPSSFSQSWGGDTGEERSRFTLVQEMLDPIFEPLRQAQFDYHFGVLDPFVDAPEEAWDRGLAVLQSLNDLYTQFNRRRYATDVFYGAKYQELTDLFRDAPVRNQAYALLAEMDAAHIGTYDALVNG